MNTNNPQLWQRIKTKITNKETDKPIEGAVIRGWNESWGIGMNTFTDENGEFTLYSNDICTHFEISAPGMTKKKFNYHANYLPISNTNISLQSLPNQNLEYQKIAYKPFLLTKNIPDTGSSAPYIFNFDKSKFNNAIFQGKMEVIELSPLDIEIGR